MASFRELYDYGPEFDRRIMQYRAADFNWSLLLDLGAKSGCGRYRSGGYSTSRSCSPGREPTSAGICWRARPKTVFGDGLFHSVQASEANRSGLRLAIRVHRLKNGTSRTVVMSRRFARQRNAWSRRGSYCPRMPSRMWGPPNSEKWVYQSECRTRVSCDRSAGPTTRPISEPRVILAGQLAWYWSARGLGVMILSAGDFAQRTC